MENGLNIMLIVALVLSVTANIILYRKVMIGVKKKGGQPDQSGKKGS